MFFHLGHIPLFLHFALLCVGFYTVDEATTSPSLEGLACVGAEPYHSTLLQLLVVSQTFVIVQAAYYIFNSS